MLAYEVATATKGAIIDFATAFAESSVRQFWLDVTFEPKGPMPEKERTVSVWLGATPVLLGSTVNAAVRLAADGLGNDLVRTAVPNGQANFEGIGAAVKRILNDGESVTIWKALGTLKSKVQAT